MHRFTGAEGVRRIADILSGIDFIGAAPDMAKWFAERVSPKEISSGELIYQQGERAHGILYVLLCGACNILVDGNVVTTLTPGQSVGSFPLIDPTLNYSVSLQATETSFFACIAEEDFVRAANDNPVIWRKLAKKHVARILELDEGKLPKNTKPIVFVGSASEDTRVAKELQRGLRNVAEVHVWTDNVFKASQFAIESLLTEVRAADFSVFVISGVDETKSRDRVTPAARDNVIFEIGLAMAELGRARTIVVQRRGEDLKIPSDLMGLMTETFATPGDDSALAASLGPACTSIEELVRKLGTRVRLSIRGVDTYVGRIPRRVLM